jgi:alpha-L-fucosidase 2
MDIHDIVSRADLHYEGTVDVSDEGLPVGNGTMASLVWTSPWSVKLQINRVDVYASDSKSRSFNRRNEDYSTGCAMVDIDLSPKGREVFSKESTRQRLSVYDGMVTLRGDGVVVRVVSSQSTDVFGIEIEDSRTNPEPITARLRMLRPPEVYEKHHSVVSNCEFSDTHIALKQVFREDEFYCSSAVAIAASGGAIATKFSDETGGREVMRSSAKIRGIGQSMETEIAFSIEPGARKRFVYVGSAASFDPETSTASRAHDVATAAAHAGFEHLVSEALVWWRDFWSGSHVHLESADGDAAVVESHYNYFLYLMACCSRGRYAPRYGCMLFSTHGDKRAWGAQQWWTNLSLYYRGLLPTGKYELLDGFYNHYWGIKESCELAARQQWGSDGIYFPETIWFDGLAPLPDDIAEEMQDLYLCRKPWEKRSAKFDEYASIRHPHSSRWNWIGHGKWVDGKWSYGYNAVPPFSPVNHFFASGAEIAFLFWKQYEYSRDQEWLRDTAYPILRGVAEFLCSFPNFRIEADGKYHVVNVNQGEHLRGARDTFDFLCAVRGVLPAAAKAAAILGIDEESREKWIEIAEKTASLPTSDDPESVERGAPGEPRRFTDGRTPVVDGKPRPGIEEFNSRFYDYDLGNLTGKEAGSDLFEISNNTFDRKYPEGVLQDTPVRVMSSLPIIAAKLARPDDFRNAVLNIIRVLDPATDFCDYLGQGARGALANRMTNREGVNAIGAQRLGSTVYAVNEALCQSDPSEPGGTPTARVFPAWPKEWDADFCLRVRGGFSVASRMTNGSIPRVEIAVVETHADESIRIRNPWPGRGVKVARSSGGDEMLRGELLEVAMDQGVTVTLLPA